MSCIIHRFSSDPFEPWKSKRSVLLFWIYGCLLFFQFFEFTWKAASCRCASMSLINADVRGDAKDTPKRRKLSKKTQHATSLTRKCRQLFLRKNHTKGDFIRVQSLSARRRSSRPRRQKCWARRIGEAARPEHGTLPKRLTREVRDFSENRTCFVKEMWNISGLDEAKRRNVLLDWFSFLCSIRKMQGCMHKSSDEVLAVFVLFHSAVKDVSYIILQVFHYMQEVFELIWCKNMTWFVKKYDKICQNLISCSFTSGP